MLAHVVGLADDDAGLTVLDLTDPALPTLLASVPFATAYGVAVAGDYAYVATGSGHGSYAGGLLIIDIRRPQTPTLTGNYAITSWHSFAWGVAVTGDFAYVTASHPLDDHGYLEVIHVSSPENPTLAGVASTAGYGVDVAVAENRAYVATAGSVLKVFDVSNPHDPALVHPPFCRV